MNRRHNCVACGHKAMTDLGRTPEGLLWRCSICGTLRLGVAASGAASDAGAYGEAYREGVDPDKADRIYDLFRRVFGNGPNRGRLLLDVGCADGAFLALASRDGWTVCGVDADPTAVAAVTRLGLSAFCGRVGGALPACGPFDVVTFWDVLEHLPDIPLTMQWLSGVLHPGGSVVVLTPNAGSVLDHLAQLERRLSGRQSQRLMTLCLNRYHLHRFTVHGLTGLFRRYGFLAQRVSTVRLFSLHPAQYLTGFAPGISGWTPFRGLNRGLSQVAFEWVRLFGVRNKILLVARQALRSTSERVGHEYRASAPAAV